MVIVRFDDADAERRAIGYLAGRYSFKTWASGDFMLHEEALPDLAREGIAFKVQGRATYEQTVPSLRNPAATAVQ